MAVYYFAETCSTGCRNRDNRKKYSTYYTGIWKYGVAGVCFNRT